MATVEGTAASLAQAAVARVTVNLPSQVWAALTKLAERLRISKTEALRRAITTYVFLMKQQDDGKEILLRKDGNVERIIFQ